MKFTGIIAATLLTVGALAQNDTTTTGFDVSALYGTWHVAAITKVFLAEVTLVAKAYNITIECPEVNIASGTDSAVSIQPAIQVGYYNETSQETESVSLTMDGSMTLDEGSTPTEANFKVTFTPPPLPGNGAPPMADHMQVVRTFLTVGDHPAPEGGIIHGNLNFKVNAAVENAALVRASDFSDDEPKPIAPTDPTPPTDGEPPAEPAPPTDGEPAPPTDGEPAPPTDGEPAPPTDGEPAPPTDGDTPADPPTDAEPPVDPSAKITADQYYPPYYPPNTPNTPSPPTNPNDPNDPNSPTGGQAITRRDLRDQISTTLVVKGANTLDVTAFDAAVAAFGSDATDLVRLEDTCH